MIAHSNVILFLMIIDGLYSSPDTDGICQTIHDDAYASCGDDKSMTIIEAWIESVNNDCLFNVTQKLAGANNVTVLVQRQCANFIPKCFLRDLLKTQCQFCFLNVYINCHERSLSTFTKQTSDTKELEKSTHFSKNLSVVKTMHESSSTVVPKYNNTEQFLSSMLHKSIITTNRPTTRGQQHLSLFKQTIESTSPMMPELKTNVEGITGGVAGGIVFIIVFVILLWKRRFLPCKEKNQESVARMEDKANMVFSVPMHGSSRAKEHAVIHDNNQATYSIVNKPHKLELVVINDYNAIDSIRQYIHSHGEENNIYHHCRVERRESDTYDHTNNIMRPYKTDTFYDHVSDLQTDRYDPLVYGTKHVLITMYDNSK